MAIADYARQGIVTVGEDIRLDHNLLAQCSLDGEPTGIDLGRDSLDDDALSRVSWVAGECCRLGGGGAQPSGGCASHVGNRATSALSTAFRSVRARVFLYMPGL